MASGGRIAYWDQGVRHVPAMTGALSVMDCRDLRSVCKALRIALPLADVLDVGCGTGRATQLCTRGYVGLDIAPSAVAYCAEHGIVAHQIDGPDDVAVAGGRGSFAWILCISVFTHIPRSERIRYLEAFALVAPSLLVDIIPGLGAGDVAMWTADPEGFERDAAKAGWRIVAAHDESWDTPPAANVHRYYRMERA